MEQSKALQAVLTSLESSVTLLKQYVENIQETSQNENSSRIVVNSSKRPFDEAVTTVATSNKPVAAKRAKKTKIILPESHVTQTSEISLADILSGSQTANESHSTTDVALPGPIIEPTASPTKARKSSISRKAKTKPVEVTNEPITSKPAQIENNVVIEPVSETTACVSSESTAAVKGQSETPQKHPNAFHLYTQEKRPIISAENPALKKSEIYMLIQTSWKESDASVKNEYAKKALALKLTATDAVEIKKNDLIDTKGHQVETALIQSHSNNTENSEKNMKAKKMRKPATPKKATSRVSVEISAQDLCSPATTDAIIENSIIQDQLEIQIIQPVIQEEKNVLSQEPPSQTTSSKKSRRTTRPKEYVDVQESSELATPAALSIEPSQSIADECTKSVAPLEKKTKKKSKEERPKKQKVDSIDGNSKMPVPSILDKMLGISN